MNTQSMNYYCAKCEGTTYDVDYCDNPSCPNQPCCGKPKDLCTCYNDSRLKQTFEDLGFIPNLYIVGGAVRDHVMRNTIADVDVASKNLPHEIINMCEYQDEILPVSIKHYATGIEHGTITIVVDGRSYEHTTFRKDSNCDGRHAEVEYTSSLEEDAARRDFTMNAMYMDSTGDILDPHEGLIDIYRRTLRTVGDARDRFDEDALRSMRALRFKARFNLELAEELKGPFGEIYATDISNISIERIVMEIDKAFKHDGAGSFVMYLYQYEIWREIVPELADMAGLAQNPEYHPEIYVPMHIIEVVDRCDPKYRWHALFHDIGKLYTAAPHKTGDWSTFYNHDTVGAKKVGEICRRLKLPNRLTKEIEMVCRYHMMAYTIKKPSKLRKFAYNTKDYRECIKAVFHADHPDNEWPELPEIPKFPDGYAIHAATGIPLNTPEIGQAIIDMRNAWIANGISDKDKLLGIAKKKYSASQTKDN